MAVPEIVDEYFNEMLADDVNDYIEDNLYDEDDVDFDDYMHSMGAELVTQKGLDYEGQTDEEICDALDDTDLYEEIMKFAKESGCRETSASECFLEVYAIFYDKYIKGWEESDLKATIEYVQGRV